MLTRTKAIVLHSIKFGDSQMITDMLTEQYGRLSFISHIPKTARGKVKKQFLQPLSMLDIEFDYRQNMKLQHIKDARVDYPFTTIPFDPYKLSLSLFVAEFLYNATRSEQSNAPMFTYIENSVKWLDSSVRSFSNFHIVFMMRLLRFLGFTPNLEGYNKGDYFDLQNGCFTSSAPLHPYFMQPDEAAKIVSLMRMGFESMHLFVMSRAERNRCVELTLLFYKLQIPNFPELKSLEVLKEVYD